MKKKHINKIKQITSLVFVISLIFLNSFSLIASAYGADIDDLDSASVYIRNVGSGKYLTVPNGTVSDGKGIKIYDATENVSQQWVVCELPNGNYYICSKINSSYVLSVESGTNGAELSLKQLPSMANIPESAQFLMLSITEYQCAYLISQLSIANNNLRGLDCKNNGTTNGTNVVQYDLVDNFDDGVSQLWVFEDVNRSIELNSWNLVDSGGHCDWDCSSQYSAMVMKATNAWNSYIGDEVFRPDAWNVVEDVKIKDMDTDPSGKGAIATTFSSSISSNGTYARNIHFYKDKMEQMDSDLQRQHTVMHELGHALGLGHNRTAEHAVSDRLGNIMQQGELPYGTFISLDDKASVEQAYAGF